MDRKESNKDFKELYTQTFSQLTASQEKLQEVINMTENRKPRKIARRMLVAAAVMALAVALAMGANAASGGELFMRIVSYVTYETEDGQVQAGEMVIEVEDDSMDGSSNGEFYIYQEGEDGKAIMSYTDENGKQVEKEIDLDQVPSAKAPALRLEDKDGKYSEFSAEGIQMDNDNHTAVITYTGPNGETGTVALKIPEKFWDYESVSEMLLDGPVSGTTQDGRHYELSQAK